MQSDVMAKWSKVERKRLREVRKERQIIMKMSRKLGFEYICGRTEQSKICFGSTTPKDCLPVHGPSLSGFMRRFVLPSRDYPGPGDYPTSYTLVKNYASLRGYDGLATRAPRLVLESPFSPPVGSYNIEHQKVFKQNLKPFGIGNGSRMQNKFLTPTPGTYNFFKRNLNTVEAFLSTRKIAPAVKVICTPLNLSKCVKCEEQPIGDYWHYEDPNKDLCHACMAEEIDFIKRKYGNKISVKKRVKLDELKQFNRVRYCGFYHEHNGTSAAVRLLTKKELISKMRREDYLYTFGI